MRMANLVIKLPERFIEHTALVKKPGFDPLFIFKE
jgi:hypothetical protein